MSRDVRILAPGDEALLEAFCRSRPDTTLFLRGNSLEAGLEDRGERLQGSYAAVLEDGVVRGVATHCWNGNMLLDAPVALGELVHASIEASGRAVVGFLGPWEQALAARRGLGLEERPTKLECRETLFGLDLAELTVPPALSSGAVRCRRPREDELPLLTHWSVAYCIETLGEEDSPALWRQREESLRRQQDAERLWVLEAEGRPVSMSGFNAAVPGIVQVGGVYTPPELRGRGHARCVVAGSLLHAREHAVERSVLFTDEENASAQAAYRALGFRCIGDYAILFFEEPWSPAPA